MISLRASSLAFSGNCRRARYTATSGICCTSGWAPSVVVTVAAVPVGRGSTFGAGAGGTTPVGGGTSPGVGGGVSAGTAGGGTVPAGGWADAAAVSVVPSNRAAAARDNLRIDYSFERPGSAPFPSAHRSRCV